MISALYASHILSSAVSRTFAAASISSHETTSASNIALFVFILQMAEYRAAQEAAKRRHVKMWMYGDITEDDAEEFGLGR